jgi:hypothetical protein
VGGDRLNSRQCIIGRTIIEAIILQFSIVCGVQSLRRREGRIINLTDFDLIGTIPGYFLREALAEPLSEGDQ